MKLCLDVGNTHIFGGVFVSGNIKLRFRYDTKQTHSSDQIGIFFKQVLIINGIDPKHITNIAISSVVPSLNYSVRAACIKYFNLEPLFLKAGVKTGLKIKTKHPTEVGADLIAGAIGAVALYPNEPLLIVDFGTATTIAVIDADKNYLGTVILPGFKTSMEALKSNTAQLPSVSIEKPNDTIGRTTKESIQIGLYYMQYAALKELAIQISNQYFSGKKARIIGTGGFVNLFEQDGLFDNIRPDLVLEGLYICLNINQVVSSITD